ncbi:hypothetical protein B9G69_002450 [Bdellovibrio sp. SKB1291214]|uniref:hypothetical protein n=1 Tax=Bdellovibrio sp. SKB1291214 TaxID=1732569 RepID=UPI000B6EEE20|nr:hypothetical protein [Bdellovibrio sp. SKB1291214]UYL09433.1 hypothetical protein B9G69_002450 [Bdellovibrio sp. SKB1291214]
MKVLKYISVFFGILMVVFVVYVLVVGDSMKEAKKRQIVVIANQVESFLNNCSDCQGKFPTGISAKAFLKEYHMRNYAFFRAEDLCTGLRNELSKESLPYVTETDYQIVVTDPPWIAIKRKDAEPILMNLGENHGQYCR